MGLTHSRWTLKTLLAVAADFIRPVSLSGFGKTLKAFGITKQRARSYVHSPDPEYDAKLAQVLSCLEQARHGNAVVVFLDEFSYENHASVSHRFAPRREQPLAGLATGGTKTWRIVGTLDALSGKVVHLQRKRISVPALVTFLKMLVAAYPEDTTIYVVLDNWPIHFHPDVLDAMVEQTTPFAFRIPQSWEQLKPSGKYSQLKLPIQLVQLPTYASWLNPIERLWKWLKANLMHLHPFAFDFNELINQVDQMLSLLANGSNEILSFVGLNNPTGIFAPANL